LWWWTGAAVVRAPVVRPPVVRVVLVVVVVVVVPVTGLRLVAVRRLAPPPRSLLLRLGCAVERVVRVVRGVAVVREDVRGMFSVL
jgi:hypothetical protein